MKLISLNKKVKNATSVTYDNVNFKSKLELYCYKKLKENNIDFNYNSTKFNLLNNFVFLNDSYELIKKKNYKNFEKADQLVRGISYTPDFVGFYPDGKMFIIETKGNPNEIFPLKWKLLKNFLKNNSINSDLFMPRNQKHVDIVVNIIKTKTNEH